MHRFKDIIVQIKFNNFLTYLLLKITFLNVSHFCFFSKYFDDNFETETTFYIISGAATGNVDFWQVLIHKNSHVKVQKYKNPPPPAVKLYPHKISAIVIYFVIFRIVLPPNICLFSKNMLHKHLAFAKP